MIKDEISSLKRVRAFIEYARYCLEPGKAEVPNQFPGQVDADEAIQRVDNVISSLLGLKVD